MDVASAKAFLQKKEGATSVYEHLTEVILKIISEQPSNGVAAFEQISNVVKSATYPPPTAADRSGGEAALETYRAHQRKHLQQLSDLTKLPGGDEGAPGEPVQDFLEESSYLEWAGIGFGRTEAFRMHLSLKHLAAAHPAQKLRFWGKILGTHADYLIAEAVMDATEEEADDARDALGNVIQKTGTGPNRHTYFYCHVLGGTWTKLPNVTPHQIVVARQIRRYLSGNPDAAVRSHPPFPGKEVNLLRAMIALISAGTSLAPAGMYTAVEGDDEGGISPTEEEWGAPDMTQLDGWVHTELDLNTLGRTRPNPPRIADDGEEIPDPDAPDPSVPLKSISEDLAVSEDEEGGGAWDIRSVPVAGVPEGEPTGIAVVRSRQFPGAVTVGFQQKRFVSFYIGHGHTAFLKPYQLPLPAALPAEYDMGGDAPLAEQFDVTVDPDEGKDHADEGDGDDM